MHVGHCAQSYRFDDLVRHWARERLVHEVLVARELAHGVLYDGLRLENVQANLLDFTVSLRGDPFVGYVARSDRKPIIVRKEILEHLREIASAAADPQMHVFGEEFVRKQYFKDWLIDTGRLLPNFWFALGEQAA